MNVGKAGVVMSLTTLEVPWVNKKIRVRVMMAVFFTLAGSGFFRLLVALILFLFDNETNPQEPQQASHPRADTLDEIQSPNF